MESRLLCDAILSPYEQGEIEQAAMLAHLNHHFEAERCRRFAGYDRLWNRPNADRVHAVS